MSTVLHIDSSIFDTQGQSSTLTANLVEGLKTKHNAEVIHRNLASEGQPHFDASTLAALGENRAELADTLIDEVQKADIVVIGAPMYNFTIPSQLKAWFDHIARAGVTFKYTESGPVGLLSGKKVYVVTTRGGQHRDSSADHVVPYLKTILNFLGLAENLKFVYAEGLALSDHKAHALEDARETIQQYLDDEEAA